MTVNPISVMKDLSFLFPIIYTALDHGVSKTKEFFQNQEEEPDKKIDPYFAPNHVRFYALRHLKRAGQDVYEDDVTDDLSVANIPNNGMHINYGRYQIKILKSNNGDLPVPGHSRIRQGYYSQPSFLDCDEAANSMTINLLLLWNVKWGYAGLGVLTLACPKAGGSTRESVSHHFHVGIPPKMLYGEYNIGDTINEEEVYDLPLRPNIEETGTGD